MNRFFKTFLLWLLIAVLPLHAVAVTMSTSCGPIHHKAMEVAFQVDTHHHHDGDSAHSHHHDDADIANSESAGSVTDNASPGAPDKHQHSACSACAATCVGACAPPSALNSTPTFDGSEMVVVSPAPLATGIIPGGLERPPRHIFA
jgi:hypothetical protein